MKKISIVILILTIFALSFADTPENIIKNTKINISLENASAVNIFTNVTMKINEDNSYSYNVFYIKKILTYKGKKRYSDVKISYNSDYQKIKINKAFTIDSNGKRIQIPENQIYDLDDQMALYSPEYIKIRQRILNFPQIEPNSYIVLDYTLTSSRKLPVSGVEHLQESNPYIKKCFTLIYPQDKKMSYYYPKNKNVAFSESEKDGMKIMKFEIENSPLIRTEPNQPSYLQIGTPVVYSFYKDWREMGNLIFKNYRIGEISQSIKETALKISKDAKSDREKILAIYKYMAGNFMTKYSIPQETNLIPDSPEKIQSQKYGSIKDMVFLFLNYAKALDIDDVYPALVLDKSDKDCFIQKKFPLINFVDDINVYWKGNLLVPGDINKPFILGSSIDNNILVGYKKAKLISYRPKINYLRNFRYEYDFTGKKVIVSVENQFAGKFNVSMRQRYLNIPKDRVKIAFNNSLGLNSANLIAGPNFENFDKIDENIKFDYKLQYDDLLVKQDEYSYFKSLVKLVDLDVSKVTREFPYQISNQIKDKNTIVINLKDREEVINPPKKIKISYKIGKRKAYYKLRTKTDGNKIIIESELYIPSGIVGVQKYPEFRKFVLKLKNKLNAMVFLKK